MSKVETDVYAFKDDVGKNLLAKDKDEADQKFLDHGGIDHSAINKSIVDASDGVETYMVDANYTDSDTTKYLGKVKYDDDNINQTLEEAIEAEDIHIDTWAAEDEPKQMTVAEAVEVGQKLKKEKEESDVDVALNLQAESQRGK